MILFLTELVLAPQFRPLNWILCQPPPTRIRLTLTPVNSLFNIISSTVLNHSLDWKVHLIQSVSSRARRNWYGASYRTHGYDTTILIRKSTSVSYPYHPYDTIRWVLIVSNDGYLDTLRIVSRTQNPPFCFAHVPKFAILLCACTKICHFVVRMFQNPPFCCAHVPKSASRIRLIRSQAYPYPYQYPYPNGCGYEASYRIM